MNKIFQAFKWLAFVFSLCILNCFSQDSYYKIFDRDNALNPFAVLKVEHKASSHKVVMKLYYRYQGSTYPHVVLTTDSPLSVHFALPQLVHMLHSHCAQTNDFCAALVLQLSGDPDYKLTCNIARPPSFKNTSAFTSNYAKEKGEDISTFFVLHQPKLPTVDDSSDDDDDDAAFVTVTREEVKTRAKSKSTASSVDAEKDLYDPWLLALQGIKECICQLGTVYPDIVTVPGEMKVWESFSSGECHHKIEDDTVVYRYDPSSMEFEIASGGVSGICVQVIVHAEYDSLRTSLMRQPTAGVFEEETLQQQLERLSMKVPDKIEESKRRGVEDLNDQQLDKMIVKIKPFVDLQGLTVAKMKEAMENAKALGTSLALLVWDEDLLNIDFEEFEKNKPFQEKLCQRLVDRAIAAHQSVN
ncbi:hypothetical protein [Spongorhabdus nitratireducens]